MGFIALVRCVLALRCGLAGVVWYPDEIKKQVTSSWSLFIQPPSCFDQTHNPKAHSPIMFTVFVQNCHV